MKRTCNKTNRTLWTQSVIMTLAFAAGMYPPAHAHAENAATTPTQDQVITDVQPVAPEPPASDKSISLAVATLQMAQHTLKNCSSDICTKALQHVNSALQTLTGKAEKSTTPAQNNAQVDVYDFPVLDITGSWADLDRYRGKVALIVNVASKCGYTKQYAGLQKLHTDHADKGLVVLGFPANNFGSQEPGTNEQIHTFCRKEFGVTFPMFAKISVKGDNIHPLYAFLTSEAALPGKAGPITWNFNKFLVGRDGQVIARYESKTAPSDKQLLADIRKALDNQ